MRVTYGVVSSMRSPATLPDIWVTVTRLMVSTGSRAVQASFFLSSNMHLLLAASAMIEEPLVEGLNSTVLVNGVLFTTGLERVVSVTTIHRKRATA